MRASARLLSLSRSLPRLGASTVPQTASAAVRPPVISVSGEAAVGPVFPGMAGVPSDAASMTAAHTLRTPMIEPEFWPGTAHIPASEYTIDAGELGLSDRLLRADGSIDGDADVPQTLQEDMKQRFHDVGVVLVRNTGLGDSNMAMARLVSVLAPNAMQEYKGGANARQVVEGNVFETGAPRQAHLHYHHEMAYVSKSTKLLGFCCSGAIGDGLRGASFLSDGVATTDALMATELGEKLRDKGISYIRNLTDGTSEADDDPSNEDSHVYNHWQKSFGVTTRAEAEEAAASRGLEFEWGANGLLKTRYTVSAFEYFPQLDKNLLYSSVADDSMWFDTWPGVRKLPTMESFQDATEAQRPLKITFGDGTDLTRKELEEFVNVYDQFGIPVAWEKGDVLVFCNYRWAHGRPAYELYPGEQRNIGVVLGDMYDRVGQRDDKW